MEINNIVTFSHREEWRNWLEHNFQKENQVWLVFYKKDSGKKSMIYNDAVEEALCYGWIDSITKRYAADSRVQRFTPRKSKNSYSQINIERLKWLLERKMVHPSIVAEVEILVNKPFIFPSDIMDTIRQNENAWNSFQTFSESYKRIRVAYIEQARGRKEEFNKRLQNFISKTAQGKRIMGYGGVEKYY